MSKVLKRIASTMGVLAVLAGAGALIAAPASAAGGYSLEILPGGMPSNGGRIPVTSAIVSPIAILSREAEAPVPVVAEFEGGSNDPDLGASYDTPDGGCVVPVGELACDMVLHFGVSSTADTVRFYIAEDGAQVDTWETAQDVPFVTFDWGCVEEPDGTETVVYTSLIVFGTGSPGERTPPAGAETEPYTCENPRPGASPTPSLTSTATPTETETGTASPTPTFTTTASPTSTPSETPSPSPSPTFTTASPTPTPTDSGTPSLTPTATPSPVRVAQAPYEGRYRGTECTSVTPGNAPSCQTGAAADRETGSLSSSVSLAPGETSTVAPEGGARAVAGVESEGTGDDGFRVYVFRFRLDYATVQTTRGERSVGEPMGSVSFAAHIDSDCGSSNGARQISIPNDGEVEGRIVEVRVDAFGCESPLTIQGELLTEALITPSAWGTVRVEARGALLSVTRM